MKACLLLGSLFISSLLLSTCKEKEEPEPENDRIVHILGVTELGTSILKEKLRANNGDLKAALEFTAQELTKQENVDTAFALDGAYLFIYLNSGLKTAICLFEKKEDGLCLTRGGNGNAKLLKMNAGGKCSNVIENKNVLIYAAVTKDFYKGGELEKLATTFSNAGGGYNVQILKDEQCTPGAVSSLRNYGLVILETHGEREGFMTGLGFTFPQIPKTEKEAQEKIRGQIGEDVLNNIINGDLSQYLQIYFNRSNNNWWEKIDTNYHYKVWMNSSYLKKNVPDMPGTIVLGNMCYGGYMNPVQMPGFKVKDPIAAAFLSKNPIAYYSYGNASGTSRPVVNDFAKACEDSLINSLIFEIDSTGNAHLQNSGAEFNDPGIPPTMVSPLSFKQYGNKTYCFGCGEKLVDKRDGKTYATVCIGKQVWMAENLNYEVAGSKCYDNNSAHCNTFGRLYDWNTLMAGNGSSDKNPSTVRGICPEGWHLPSSSEWTELFTFLGGTQVAGGKMKSTNLWLSPNTGATNSSGFAALPSGLNNANPNNPWAAMGVVTYFWSTTEVQSAPTQVNSVIIKFDSNVARLTPILKADYGNVPLLLPCRCVKD